MIAYASRTGTRRNLEALRASGWRMIVSAANDLRHEGFPYALDNGAWSYHQQGRPFDERRYELAVDALGARADWVVVPDVVADADATMRLTETWLPRLPIDRVPRLLVAVQDGMTVDVVDALIRDHGKRVGIFLGGSTEWKLRTMDAWGAYCLASGRYFHVARVNSARRIRAAAFAHADSFDGTSVSRYVVTLPRLDGARREGTLNGDAWCDPPRDFDADARLVRGELATYRDDEEVTLQAGALRRLLTMARTGECP